MHYPASLLQRSEEYFKGITGALVDLAYVAEERIPSFFEEGPKALLKTRLDFWKVVNNHAFLSGPYPLLKLFSHAAKSISPQKRSSR